MSKTPILKPMKVKPKKKRKSKRSRTTKVTTYDEFGKALKFTDQKETQEEYQEEIEELEEMVKVLTDYYGGKEFKVKLFRGLDLDSNNRSNDTDFNNIPMSMQDIRTKTRKPYRLLSRAGHRFVAPADIVQHKASIETAIRRINNKSLTFPDKLFEINPRKKDAGFRRKYYLNLLTNMVWDCLIEQKLPNLLPDELRDDYLKGRENVLQKANIQNLDDSMMSRVKKLQYLFSLFIHQKQHPKSKTDTIPIDVESQLSDYLSSLNNPKTSLVRKVQDMLPSYIELLQKDKKDQDQDNNQNQKGKGNNQDGKGQGKGFSISQVIDGLDKSGSGNEKFGATYLDYFDPTKELSVTEQAKVEQQVQQALQDMGEEVSSGGKEKIPSMKSDSGKGGKQAGQGINKINTYEESPFSKYTPELMDAEYSEILSDSIQRTQKHLANKKGKQERIGNAVWNTSDPTRELLLLDSISTSGLLIPNTTTLKAIYDFGENTDSYEYSSNLIVLIDVSGSMSGKALNLAIEAALSSCMVAKEERGKISVIAFETQAWEISPPTDDIEIVKDRLQTLRAIGGTSIRAAWQVVNEHLQDMGKANILMITDAYISDWRDKSIMDVFSMIEGKALNFNIFQMISRSEQLEAGDFLTFLQENFRKANFFGINYHEAENFTDKVLTAINL